MLPALLRSKNGGLKPLILKLNLSTIVSNEKADDARGENCGACCDFLPVHPAYFFRIFSRSRRSKNASKARHSGTEIAGHTGQTNPIAIMSR